MLFERVAAGPGQLDGLADGDATMLTGGLDDGVVGSGSEIAQREGLHHSTVNELLRLTLLEPAIIQTILAGQQPRCMSLLWFQQNPLPTDWVLVNGRCWRLTGLRALDHPCHVIVASAALAHQQQVAALDSAAEVDDRFFMTALPAPDVVANSRWRISAGIDSQRWRAGGVKLGNDSTPMDGSFLEQFGVRTRTHEDDGVALQPVDQQEVSADVTFAVVGPITLQRVIKPFRPQRGIIADKQQHRLFQPIQVVAA